MLSNRAVALSYQYAYNRILFYSRGPLKDLREAYSADEPLPDVTDDLRQAFFAGLLTSYYYGRLGIAGELHKLGYFAGTRAVQYVDWTLAPAVLRVIFKQDKELVNMLLTKTFAKVMTNELDAYAAYFSPSAGAMQFFSDYTLQLALVLQQDVSKQATVFLQHTIEQGMSAADATAYIKAKIHGLTRQRAAAIARTEATRGFNIGTLEEAKGSTIVAGYRFNAVLDSLTTEICKLRDGKFIPKEDTPMLARNTPPLHVNCRSRLEVVTDFDKKKRDYLDERTVPATKQRDSDYTTLIQVLNSR